MQMQHTKQDNVDFIKLPKRIMMADARSARKYLKKFSQQVQPMLALDMSETEFVDSSGLAVLVNCLQGSRKNAGEVCIFGMQDTVRALFELTRLHTVFPIEADRNGALRRLQA